MTDPLARAVPWQLCRSSDVKPVSSLGRFCGVGDYTKNQEDFNQLWVRMLKKRARSPINPSPRTASFYVGRQGPKIDMRYGRVDTKTAAECPREGNLPGANAPFDDASPDAPAHLRKVFHRMGFSDGEIVALSGAHTIGR